MSHFAKYDVKISNLEFVKKALIDMGYHYQEGGTVKTNFGESRPAELVVVRNGKPISVGICRNEKSNELELIADWWGLGIPQNEFTARLAQHHSKYQVLQVCEENRWNVETDSIQFNENGDLEILATSFA